MTLNDISESKLFIVYILVLFTISRVIMYLIFACESGDWSIPACISAYNKFDSGWYFSYVSGILGNSLPHTADGQAWYAFFPLYPIIVSVVYRITGCAVEIGAVGSFVSSFCFIISEYVAYKYIMLTRNSVKTAVSYIAFMSMGIYSFYFSIFYTEGMFLLFLTLCFYFMKQEKYIQMGIAGALLSATRNVGVLFVFVVLIHRIMIYFGENKILLCTKTAWVSHIPNFIMSNIRNLKLVFGTLLIPVGLFSYMVFLEYYVGDWLAFVHVQKAWDRGINGIRILGGSLFHKYPPDYLGVFAVFCFLFIVYSIIKYRRFDEMIFPLMVIVIAGSSGITSIPRFMIAAFTVVLAFADEYIKFDNTAKVMVAFCIFIFEQVFTLHWLMGCGYLI